MHKLRLRSPKIGAMKLSSVPTILIGVFDIGFCRFSACRCTSVAAMICQFHPVASGEYWDSIAFYESRIAGLGADYIAEFESLRVKFPDVFASIH